MTTDPLTRLSNARARLLLDQPFFGTLALRLRLVEDAAKTTTAATDGTHLYYSPAWVAKQSDRILETVQAHEVLHCGLLHPYRLGGRDLALANQAADHVVNLELKAAGFHLWEGALADERFTGLSFEQVYAMLNRERQERPEPRDEPGGAAQDQDGDEPGGVDGDGEQPGGVLPAPDPTMADPDTHGEVPSDQDGEQPMNASDWQIASEQAAMVARKAGRMAGGVDEQLHDARANLPDPWAILRQFIEQTVPQDYAWSRPNRRYVAQGLYLPGTYKENMPKLGIAVDRSGSQFSPAVLERFAGEITTIVQEYRPAEVEVIYFDTEVQGVETFTPDDQIVLHPRGGGGTLFQPIFDHFDAGDEPPAAVIVLTDLYGENTYGAGPVEPAYPVLWAVSECSTVPEPFGTRVVLPEVG